MKFRLFAVTVLLICFYGQASAQTYHIRVTQNTNLRASYSLQSGIAETVPAGTTLQVGGSFNRWLSISRNGDVWMADWVPYDRVESAQTPSDVNNCCFVDRQCATDQEWTDGYWAFQNNQCPVSPPATRQTSTQPSTTQPQSIDNCCFVDGSARPINSGRPAIGRIKIPSAAIPLNRKPRHCKLQSVDHLTLTIAVSSVGHAIPTTIGRPDSTPFRIIAAHTPGWRYLVLHSS